LAGATIDRVNALATTVSEHFGTAII